MHPYIPAVLDIEAACLEENPVTLAVVDGLPHMHVYPGDALEEISIPEHSTPAQMACDLTFRSLESALRLAWKWFAWDGIGPARMGFQALYPQACGGAGAECGLPQRSNGPRSFLYHLLLMRENVMRTIEATLANTDDVADPSKLSKKTRKTAYVAPDPTDEQGSLARVLLSFENAAATDVEAFVVPPARRSHGGKASESNIALEAKTDRSQLLEQIGFWRSMDETVRRVLQDETSDGGYWYEIDQNPLASALSIPRYQAAWKERWTRFSVPIYDKDHQFREDPSIEYATLVAPCDPLSRLAAKRGAEPALTHVLVDFMDTIWYLSGTPPDQVQMPAASHWLPEPDTATGWEQAVANSAIGDPKGTYFSEIQSWTLKAQAHLTKRKPTTRQKDKATVLAKALDVRVKRAQVSMAQHSKGDFGWSTAHRVLSQRLWRAGDALGVNSRSNYLILAAIYYRVNHGMEQMETQQRIVDEIDKQQYQAKHSSGILDSDEATAAAAAVHEAARQHQSDNNEDSTLAEDDCPPPFEELEGSSDPLAVQRAQYEWRFAKLIQRMKEHYSKKAAPNARRSAALDEMYDWTRFVYSHMPLARALLDGERCDDAYALEENLSLGKISRLTQCYPFTDNAWGEEVLRNIGDRFRLVDAIYKVPSGSTGTATAAAAAEVTTRAGADEAGVEDVIASGYAVGGGVSVPTVDSRLSEPAKKKRGRPPKNPPPVTLAPNGGKNGKRGRPPKTPEVSSVTPLPLPLDTPMAESVDVDMLLAEELALFANEGLPPEAVEDDDTDIDNPAQPQIVDPETALQAADDDELNQYAQLLETIRQDEELVQLEDDDRKKRASLRNVMVGNHGAMAVPVGSSAQATLGAPGCSHPIRPRVSVNTNPWTLLFCKVTPRPCADRDFASKCDQISRAHPECYEFVLQSFIASLAGLYRGCRNPAPFDLALKLQRIYDRALRYDACRHVMLAILFAHPELLIATLRENLVWQLGSDPAIWMLDSDWISGSTHVARAIFHHQRHIGGVEMAMSKGYGAHSLFAGTTRLPSLLAVAAGEPVAMGEPAAGAGAIGGRRSQAVQKAAAAAAAQASGEWSPPTPRQPDEEDTVFDDAAPNLSLAAVPHRPSIFRVTNNGYVLYMDGMFRAISSEAVHVAAANRIPEYNTARDAMTDAQREEGILPVIDGPSIYRLSEAALHMVIAEVERMRPGSPHIPVDAFTRIGVSRGGIALISLATELFLERRHDQSVKSALCGLSAQDFELFSVFFRYLNIHYKRAIVPLDRSTAERQEVAVRRRWKVPIGTEMPLNVRAFAICHIAACRDLRSMLVQQSGSIHDLGHFWLAYDDDIGTCLCLSKKCAGVIHRNTNAPPELLRRWDEELRRTDWVSEEERRSRLAKVFYGQYQLLQSEPTNEIEDSRQRSYPSQGRDIATRTVIFAEAVINATGGRGRAEPLDLISDESLSGKLAAYGATDSARVAAETAQRLVREVCTKEARQLDESKYIQPCYRSPILWAPSIGYAVGVEGKKLSPYTPATACPNCGALTVFSIAAPLATGPNGFTCGHCDWIERERADAPRCVICYQKGLQITTCSKGHQSLHWVKHILQIRLLDDISGGAMEWRTAFVCKGCWGDWMAMDDRDFTRLSQGEAPPTPVPVLASSIIAGFIADFDTGGRYSLRQCEDIGRPSFKALRTQTSNGQPRPALPPPALQSALNRFERGVTRAQLAEQRKLQRKRASILKKSKGEK